MTTTTNTANTLLLEWLSQYRLVQVKHMGNHATEMLCTLPEDLEFIETGDIQNFQVDEDGEATWQTDDATHRAIPCESQLWIYPLDGESDADDNIWDRIADEGSDRISSEAEFDAFVQSDRDNGNNWGWALIEEIWPINTGIGDGWVDRWEVKTVEPA